MESWRASLAIAAQAPGVGHVSVYDLQVCLRLVFLKISSLRRAVGVRCLRSCTYVILEKTIQALPCKPSSPPELNLVAISVG
eukprot:scaffold91001_cov32-Tisochrysis_lutea.AAC.2